VATDMKAVGRWPAWAVTLVALAAWELFWGMRTRELRSTHAP